MFKVLFLSLLIITNLFSEVKNELFILPNQGKELDERIENLIDSSKNEIIIAMYNFSHKEILKKLKLDFSSEVFVELNLDVSKYGMQISEEFQEVLFHHLDLETFFNKLTR